MNHAVADIHIATLDSRFELELADGTRLVPDGEAQPVRVECDADHAFTLADAQREEGGEPFAGYRRVS